MLENIVDLDLLLPSLPCGLENKVSTPPEGRARSECGDGCWQSFCIVKEC